MKPNKNQIDWWHWVRVLVISLLVAALYLGYLYAVGIPMTRDKVEQLQSIEG